MLGLQKTNKLLICINKIANFLNLTLEFYFDCDILKCFSELIPDLQTPGKSPASPHLQQSQIWREESLGVGACPLRFLATHYFERICRLRVGRPVKNVHTIESETEQF